ncbi:hypothetical protein B296_00025712 [Ensete ventricosum]|uniref:CAP N-terminal domain-containing protein n=1 Tax=Ensete ventricosum TaxID=4639 RepID=A0A426Z841_ENSVE|nr:hypothetical protein B296_00025712 [Ensete ventricosum]
MEQALLTRLESAVARLETLSASGSAPSVSSRDLPGAPALDPAISAFEDLVADSLGRVSDAAGKIGGQVLDATKVLEEAFAALRELLVKAKRSQKPDLAGIAEFLKPLNNVMVKANSLTEGKRSDYFNHSKTVADSLTALAWIGLAWGSLNSASLSSTSITKAPTASIPASPPPPKAPLCSTESVPSRPKEGMSAVFDEISSGKSVTAGI